MNPNNTKKSPIHENADANITCDFRDGDISRLGVAYLTYTIRITGLVTISSTLPLSVAESEYDRVSGQIQRLNRCLFQSFQSVQILDVVLGYVQVSDSRNLW